MSCVSCISGTLRPDLIESASELASGKADAIKTHHNDTDLVRELRKQVRLNTHTHTYTRSENLGFWAGAFKLHRKTHAFRTKYSHH